VKDQKEISGPLPDILRQVDETLRAHISVAADSSSGPEVRYPEYPLRALQEVVRNAVIHRTYESSNTPVKVYWY